MAGVWLLSLALRDSSIVDWLWGPGFIVVAWLGLINAGSGSPRALLLVALVTIWGLRLGLHIFIRNRGKGEDYRYARWRAEAGASWWWRSFFKVNLLQGAVMWAVSVPLTAVLYSAQPMEWTVWDALGLLLWGLGFFFEAVGDWQLLRFKANPANQGKVLDTGLWRYTRHPNYFGDATLWWGFYGFALAVGAWWTVFSPLLMTFLLVRVSGVAMLEADLKQKRPAYQDYIRRTSSFIPRPPRRS
jgi:steroid 5-alpha reductase family enzyme